MKLKYLIVLLFLACLTISVVSAADDNMTGTVELNNTDEIGVIDSVLAQENVSVVDGEAETLGIEENNHEMLSKNNSTDCKADSVEKSNPKITIKSTKVKIKESLEIDFKNSTGSPLKNKKFTAFINNKEYSLKTDSKGSAKLAINLPAKSYRLTVSFNGDKLYNNISKNFTIKVSKIPTKFVPLNNFAVKGGHLYIYLYDYKLGKMAGKKVIVTFKGKKYSKTTNRNGFIKLKVNLPKSKYSLKLDYKGDKFYNSTSKKLVFYALNSLSFRIGNSKLLTKGYLRIYLSNYKSSVAKKTIVLYINGKKIVRKTSSEGIVIVKPKLAPGTYLIKARYGKVVFTKKINCYKGSVKSPLYHKIPLRNGVPDVDVMTSNYVMGDIHAKYTLKKSQYREVTKRDSYCLYMYKKLSRYTFFKTKSHPKLNHIVPRGKWNVIEREVNKALVSANRHNYWPSEITISLVGKAYVYSEVRDVQDTDYTCGPTSASVCTQVLRNYLCESYLAKLSKSLPYEGTSCSNMKTALDKHNFLCSFYYRSSLSTAIKDLKQGGCAVIFHAYNHYVTILDISKDGKYFLVSNSYGTFDNIRTGWIKVSYMKTRFYKNYDDGLIIKLNYKLSKATKKKVSCFYTSMGKNWSRQNMRYTVGRV